MYGLTFIYDSNNRISLFFEFETTARAVFDRAVNHKFENAEELTVTDDYSHVLSITKKPTAIVFSNLKRELEQQADLKVQEQEANIKFQQRMAAKMGVPAPTISNPPQTEAVAA